MKNIHAKALSFGAAALLAYGIGGTTSTRAQAVAQPNPTAARLNAVANLIQGQTTQPTTVAQPTPYQQPGATYGSPTSGRWVTQQQPTYTTNGYVQQPYRQPTANGYVQPQQAYATPYQQPHSAGYGYTQPGQAYTPYQQAVPQTTTQRYADAVRSVVQPRRYQYVAPGYRPQTTTMFTIPR